jgi:hypothetical protein
VLTSDEYIALYQDFTTAMGAVDPTINVGPGLLGIEPFTTDVVAALAEDMDFISAHQYAGWTSYSHWRDSTVSPVPIIERVQRAVAASANPGLPILVTETNSTNWGNGYAITTYKALAFFDILISGQQQPNVASSLMWTTHSPWRGEDFVADDRNALYNDSSNAPTPNGAILKLFADTVHERFVDMPSRNGLVSSWASVDPDTGELTVYLLNRGERSLTVDVELPNHLPTDPGTRSIFGGTGPDDPAPTYTVASPAELTAAGLSTTLPPSSLVVLELIVP